MEDHFASTIFWRVLFDQSAPADQDAGEPDEAVVDVESAFPAELRESLFDDVTGRSARRRW
jgi:hypothetical protein